MNMLMLSWVAGALPTSRHQALLCSASSVGYTALRQSLGSPLYPQHTILLTNVDIREVPITSTAAPLNSSCYGAPYSVVIRNFDAVLAFQQVMIGRTFVHAISNMSIMPTEFLAGASSLQEVDLEGLDNFGGTIITSIGSNFMCWCEGLKTPNLSPLSHITAIPEEFIAGCSGLTSIDLSPLSNVTSIGRDFMAGCTGLTTINLEPLSQVTRIAWRFLSGCSGLTSIDLSPLSQVTSILWDFLAGCSGLAVIDMRPMLALISLPDDITVRKRGQPPLIQDDTASPTEVPPPSVTILLPLKFRGIAPQPGAPPNEVN